MAAQESFFRVHFSEEVLMQGDSVLVRDSESSSYRDLTVYVYIYIYIYI